MAFLSNEKQKLEFVRAQAEKAAQLVDSIEVALTGVKPFTRGYVAMNAAIQVALLMNSSQASAIKDLQKFVNLSLLILQGESGHSEPAEDCEMCK